MPGLIISEPPSPVVTVYRCSAKFLPQSILNAFKNDPRNSNIILSDALVTRDANESAEDQLWMVCTTTGELDLVLSCTHHAMGAYPVFIYSARPPSALDSHFLTPRIELLVQVLSESVDVKSVYSVFAFEMVSLVFAETWARMTNITFYENPYYAAKLTYCTRQSFRSRQFTTLPGISYDLRLAVPSDVPHVARLCHGFAAEAAPFFLTEERATEEARHLISLKQIWVHTIKEGDRPAEIASIVAATRDNGTVSAITKVFTNPRWRSRRCAERLVRMVTQTLLKRKKSVVLYVAHDNPAAIQVYNRVGFVGLDRSKPAVDGVESWMELGFDRNKVVLGHW